MSKTATAYYPQSRIPSRPDALNLAQRADLCVRGLKRQGHEVLCVQRGTHKPRVYVRHSALCGQLNGAVYMYERIQHDGKLAERRYWVAIWHGCEVRWSEGGAA